MQLGRLPGEKEAKADFGPRYRKRATSQEGVAMAPERDSHLPPLSPLAGGRTVTPAALQVGDIIVSTSNGLTSLSIRLATGGPVSHAYVYIGNPDMIIEALPEGVIEQSIDDALTDDALAVAFRSPALADGQLVANYLTSYVGAKYDSWKAFLAAIRSEDETRLVDLGETNSRYFCSELIVDAFAQAGFPLTFASPDSVMPGDLPLLDLAYVGHLKYQPPR